jgi:hypothetical protein
MNEDDVTNVISNARDSATPSISRSYFSLTSSPGEPLLSVGSMKQATRSVVSVVPKGMVNVVDLSKGKGEAGSSGAPEGKRDVA